MEKEERSFKDALHLILIFKPFSSSFHFHGLHSLFFKPSYSYSAYLKLLMPPAVFIIAVVIDGLLHFNSMVGLAGTAAGRQEQEYDDDREILQFLIFY